MRKLSHARKLWEGILDVCEVRDVFTGKPVNTKQYDIDHFILWSFVMNDELWNLMPRELYTAGKGKPEFCHILEKNMQPVYDSARRQGYEIWNRDKVQ